jgi:hypothetical protein
MGITESNAIFQIDNKEFAGVIKYSYDFGITIEFTTSELLIRNPLTELDIQELECQLNNDGPFAVLFDSTMVLTYISSNIFTYKIYASYGLFGRIQKKPYFGRILKIEFNDIDQWIGSQLTKQTFSDNYRSYSLKVDMSKAKKYEFDEKVVTILHTSTVPIGPVSNGEYSIKQNSLFIYHFSEVIEIPIIKNTIYSLRELVSFILNNPINIKKVVTTVYDDDYKCDTDVLFIARIRNIESKKLIKPIIKYRKFEEEFVDLFNRWDDYRKKVKYYDYFFNAYYTSKFLDQKLLGLIIIVETTYGIICGEKREETSNFRKYVESVISYLPEKYKENVHLALSEKNRLSLKERFLDLEKYAKDKANYPELVKRIVKFRNDLSHGNGLQNFTVEEIRNIHEQVYTIYLEFIKKDILGLRDNAR